MQDLPARVDIRREERISSCVHVTVFVHCVASCRTPRLTRGPPAGKPLWPKEAKLVRKSWSGHSNGSSRFCTFGSASCCSNLHARCHLHQCSFLSVCRSSGSDLTDCSRFCVCGFWIWSNWDTCCDTRAHPVLNTFVAHCTCARLEHRLRLCPGLFALFVTVCHCFHCFKVSILVHRARRDEAAL